MKYTGENNLVKLDVTMLNKHIEMAQNGNIRIPIRKKCIDMAERYLVNVLDKLQKHDREWLKANVMEAIRELDSIQAIRGNLELTPSAFLTKIRADLSSKDDGVLWDSLILHIAMYGTVFGVFAAGATAGLGALVSTLATGHVSIPAMAATSVITGVAGAGVGGGLAHSIYKHSP